MDLSKVNKINQLLDKLMPFTSKGEPPTDAEARWIIHGERSYYLLSTAYAELDILFKYLSGLLPGAASTDFDHILTKLLEDKIYDTFNLDQIQEQFTQLIGNIMERVIFKPVFNLEVEEDFSFGKMIFCTRKTEDKFKSATPSMLPKSWQERNEKSTLCWASMKIKGTQAYIEDYFEAELNKHIYIFNFLFHLIEQKHPSEEHICFAQPIDSFKNDIVVISNLAQGQLMSQDSSSRKILPINFSVKSKQEWLTNTYFQQLNKALKNDNEKSFSARFFRAISFYIEALHEVSDIKLLKLVIGIEALLSTGQDVKESRISNNLAEKVAYLFYDNKDERKQIRSFIKDLYDYRSEIGHGSKRFEEILEAYDAEDILFHCIKLFLDELGKPDGFKSDNDINEWFLDKKMN